MPQPSGRRSARASQNCMPMSRNISTARPRDAARLVAGALGVVNGGQAEVTASFERPHHERPGQGERLVVALASGAAPRLRCRDAPPSACRRSAHASCPRSPRRRACSRARSAFTAASSGLPGQEQCLPQRGEPPRASPLTLPSRSASSTPPSAGWTGPWALVRRGRTRGRGSSRAMVR